ncbi:MAG TPA: methylmalonyl Co-A mutase-associated GTPase MeaB [Phycisphaerae bacterium]|nr:methylmalonyl Co-A mutase-associated GTPase MeaB [Phycisphaerae bacterium]
MDALLDKLRQGDRRSLARAMSLVDGQDAQAEALTDRLRRSTGQVPWWGFTGPPGVGKSTLIDALLTILRQRGRRIGVVAVDPTSPMSDGALLGDRVRMMRHAVDRDVFIRSLATHHREGGLSDATIHCARILEVGGFDPVLIETVGVGQNEVDIASVADLSVVILGPGYGDDIQLIKAGLLEVADLVVVNKCDLPEANRLLKEVHAEFGGMPQAYPAQSSDPETADGGVPSPQPRAKSPVIVGIEAKSGIGVDDLLDRLLECDAAARTPEQRECHRRRRVLGEIRRSAMHRYELALDRALSAPDAADLVNRLETGAVSLESVIAALSEAALRFDFSPPAPRIRS